MSVYPKPKFECEWDVRNYFKYTPISVMKKPIVVLCYRVDVAFEVKTKNGWVKGKPKDWIMIGPKGDLYPCDAQVFLETYERIRDGDLQELPT